MRSDRVRALSPKTSDVARDAFRTLSALRRGRGASQILRVGPDIAVAVPREAVDVLLQALEQLAEGNSVSVVPLRRELTTQEAADLLGVSRPHLVGLLEAKRIPCRLVGTHRRVLMKDVLAYQRGVEAQRHEVLDALTAEAERLGLGY